MSFSWWCKDKDGKDLFTEFGVNGQALGLGPNGGEPGNIEFEFTPISVDQIRSAWCSVPYKDKLADAAQDAVREVQRLAKFNLDALNPPKHCDTCTCVRDEIKPLWWSGSDIRRLLAIPLDRV